MLTEAKRSTSYFLPALLLTALLFSACENDLKAVKEISKQQVNNKIDSSKAVEIIYSDSAHVKSRVITPLLLTYNLAVPYHMMPKGVKIIFFDKNLVATTTVTADSAITRNNDKVIELHRNVVLVTNKGDVFKSEELIWDQFKKQLYSNQQWDLNKADGTMLNGLHFTSDETFSHATGDSGNGVIVTKEKLGN